MAVIALRHSSIDSTRPFMMAFSTRASRYSTYSVAAPSIASTTDSSHAEIREITTGLERMENKALTQQRVVLTEEKVDNLRKLALGAKLERALDRRMSSQDAVMRPRRKTTSAVTAPVVEEKSTTDDDDSKTAVSVTDEKTPTMVETSA